MQFKSFDHAAQEMIRAHNEGRVNHEALEYLILNAPPDLKAMIRAKFHEIFPEIKPAFADADGNLFYDGATIKKAMEMSDEEFEETVSQLPEGCSRSTSDGLFRVN